MLPVVNLLLRPKIAGQNRVCYFTRAFDGSVESLFDKGGSNSVVECQLPKLDVAGSSPVSRSNAIIKSKSRIR